MREGKIIFPEVTRTFSQGRGLNAGICGDLYNGAHDGLCRSRCFEIASLMLYIKGYSYKNGNWAKTELDARSGGKFGEYLRCTLATEVLVQVYGQTSDHREIIEKVEQQMRQTHTSGKQTYEPGVCDGQDYGAVIFGVGGIGRGLQQRINEWQQGLPGGKTRSKYGSGQWGLPGSSGSTTICIGTSTTTNNVPTGGAPTQDTVDTGPQGIPEETKPDGTDPASAGPDGQHEHKGKVVDTNVQATTDVSGQPLDDKESSPGEKPGRAQSPDISTPVKEDQNVDPGKTSPVDPNVQDGKTLPDNPIDGGNDDPPPPPDPPKPKPETTNPDQSGSSAGGGQGSEVTVPTNNQADPNTPKNAGSGQGDFTLEIALPTGGGDVGESYGTGPTPGPKGNPPHNVEHGGPFFPDLTADVLTATTPVLFFLSAVTVALFGYSLWK
ncbi:hypothetical protein AK88_05230, partial [Plasmodium fragile]